MLRQFAVQAAAGMHPFDNGNAASSRSARSSSTARTRGRQVRRKSVRRSSGPRARPGSVRPDDGRLPAAHGHHARQGSGSDPPAARRAASRTSWSSARCTGSSRARSRPTTTPPRCWPRSTRSATGVRAADGGPRRPRDRQGRRPRPASPRLVVADGLAEFGYGMRGIGSEGYADLVQWRGPREDREWPARLRRADGFRWLPHDDLYGWNQSGQTA